MAEISKITLPSGNTYDLKDATARQMISGGVSFIVAWDGTSVPDVSGIPAGVIVTYNGSTYTGTLTAETEGDDPHAQSGAFYLVKSSTTPSSETLDIYDEYVPVGVTGAKFWEKIGDTKLNLADVVTDVTLSKQTDVVLGEATTFTGVDPSITVTPSTTYLGATATGTAVGADGTVAAVTGYSNPTTDTFVKSVSVTKGDKLDTTTVPNVTGNTSVTIPNVTGNTTVSIPNVTGNTSVTANKSDWSFTLGSGSDAETLIIGGGNGSDVTATNTSLGTNLTATNTTLGTALTATNTTLGTAKTVATGTTSSSGTGSAVVSDVTVGSSADAITELGTPSTANALTGVKVTAQPTVALGSNSTTATGRVQVATGISSATATGTGVTVGTNDKVTVLKDSTNVSVTKGNS